MSFEVIDCSENMRLVAQEGNTRLFEYLPSLLAPLALPFEQLRLVCKLRFCYEYLHAGHYKVYYLAVDDEFVGYCVVTPGGRRLSLTTKNDVVLGPYFILPEHRGKGYAKILVSMTLRYCTYDYNIAFDWIHKSNIPSIRISEACGMYVDGKIDVVGRFRKLVTKEDGPYFIYKYKKHSLISSHNVHPLCNTFDFTPFSSWHNIAGYG